MLTLRSSAWVSVLATALCWQCLLGAAETPLPAIPVGAELVLRVSNFTTTAGKVESVLSGLRPETQITDVEDVSLSWLIDGLLKESGIEEEDSIESRPDLEQDWWFYGWNVCGPDACFVLLIPTSNPDEYQARDVRRREQKQDMSSDSIVYKNWVVKGSTPAIEAVRQCLAGRKPSILSRFDDTSLETFCRGDLGFFVDSHAIVAAATELKKDPSEISLELVSIPFELASELFSDFFGGINWQAGNENAIMNIYVRAAIALAQVLADSERFAVCLTIDDELIQIEQCLTVKPDSATATFFKSNPGAEMKALCDLPASSAIYLGLHGDWKSKFFSAESLQKIADAEAELTASLAVEKQSLLEQEQQLNYGTISIAYPMHPFDQGLLRSVTIKEANSPELAREVAAQRLKDATILLASNSTGSIQPIRTTEKYGSLIADIVTSPDPAFDAGPAEITFNLSNILYGTGHLTTRTIYLKDRIVESVGGSKVRAAAAFRRVAESSDRSSAPDREFTKLRKRLHDRPNFLLMVDTGVLTVSAMHAWNSAVSVMMEDAELDEVDIVLAPMRIDGEMEEAMPTDAAAPAKLDAKPLEPIVDQEIAIDDTVDIPIAVQQVIKVADFETQVPKFEVKEIEKIGSTHAMIGCSLKLEPGVSRLRLVVPRQALRTLAEATGILSKKMLDAESMEIEAIPKNQPVPED